MPVPGTAEAKAPDASYYDDIYVASPWYHMDWTKSVYAPVWRKIVEVLEEQKIKSVLEIGCGT